MQHNNAAAYDVREAALVSIKSKAKSKEHPFKSATEIVRKHVRNEMPNPVNFSALPSLPTLAKVVNYHRRKTRPDDPKDPQFQLEVSYLPYDFFLEDISCVQAERHILFCCKVIAEIAA